jgi:cation diffusion facilitator family transporter
VLRTEFGQGSKYDEELYDETNEETRVGKKGKLRLKDRDAKIEAQAQKDMDAVDRENQTAAVRATQVGAVVNLCLAAGKGSVGYLIGSTGLAADGVNHLGDLLCDAVVWYTVIESRKGATADRPWGMGKLEPLGALTVGALLMATGLGIGYSAASSAYDMLTLQLAVGAAVVPQDAVVEVQHNLHSMALGISGLSIVGKEILYRYTIAAGTKANSAVVVANAWQHRSDAIVSSAVFAGLVGSMLGFPLLDPLAGLLVSGVIVKQSFSTTIDAFKDLSDMPAPKHETEQLVATCLR